MIEYVTHAYRKGTAPFQNISSLPERDALALMEEQYIEDSVFWERFADPKAYWTARKAVEAWLYTSFLAKGGTPKQAYPVYTVVGSPKWVERNMDATTKHMMREIHIPLSLFGDGDISFTYPDSMVSWFLAKDKPPGQYQAGYHGEVFSRTEIVAIVAEKGLPDEGWDTHVPDHLAHYIEAQVWNRELLVDYLSHYNHQE